MKIDSLFHAGVSFEFVILNFLRIPIYILLAHSFLHSGLKQTQTALPESRAAERGAGGAICPRASGSKKPHNGRFLKF